MNLITMKYLHKILILFFLILSVLYVYSEERLSETEEDFLLNDISRALNEIDTLKADFRQERTLWVFDDTLVTEGICYFEDPDKLRWEITYPFKTILIYNDKEIAKFELENNKPVKYNLGTEEIMKIVLSEIIYWMKGNFEQAKELYELDIISSKNYIIELVPKSENMKNIILKIDLEISRTTMHILKVSIYETQDDSIKINFFNEVNNINFNQKLFNTENPLY